MTASIERLSPLTGWQVRFECASATPNAFSNRERPFTTQVNLRGEPSNPEFLAVVRDAISCETPITANIFRAGAQAAALCLGPDEWLVVERPDTGHEIGGTDARLVLAKARGLIQCTNEAPVFRLVVLRSFANYLAEWLADAAAECAASCGLDIDRVATRLA